MHIGLLVVEFRLEGCGSLKEKRQRLSGLRDRFGKQVNIAVCESGYQNEHKKAEWSFIAVSNDDKGLSKSLSTIEEGIEESVDALVINLHRENL
ncbi:MAG: DUF503 domain-containing protein [bacterium]|nr:DUF503 domain-containing protein [bacterium]